MLVMDVVRWVSTSYCIASHKKIMYINGPILDKVKVDSEKMGDSSKYPFSLDIIKNLEDIVFPTQVTFFVGENGTGK